MASTQLQVSAADRPPHWSLREADGGEGIHAHDHLAVSVTLRRADDGTYRVLAADGQRWRRLDPPEAPTDAREATDWAVALMRQIDRQCDADRRDPVGAALRQVRGETPAEPSAPERGGDDRVCLLCGATLTPFRGDDTAARFASHVRYVDDATHADAARYLADPSAYAGRAGDPDHD